MADNENYNDSGDPLGATKHHSHDDFHSDDGSHLFAPDGDNDDRREAEIPAEDVTPSTNPGGGKDTDDEITTAEVLYGYMGSFMGYFNFIITDHLKADDYLEEIVRLGTYSRYQNLGGKPPATDCARAGFISLANFDASRLATDELACLWCGLVVKDLSPSINVLAMHRSLSKNVCKFLTGEVGNVPLVEDSLGSELEDVQTTTVIEGIAEASSSVGTSHLRIEPDSYDEPDGASGSDSQAALTSRYRKYDQYVHNRMPGNQVSAELQHLLTTNTASMASLGIMEQSRETGMAIESNRILSFKTYGNPSINTNRFAKSGWYWSGRDNEMICFSCGAKSSDWPSDVDPMRRHILMNRFCAFIISNCDTNFINTTLETEPPYVPPPPQLHIEAVQSRATKPRHEYLPFQNLRENAERFDITERQFKDYSWTAVEDRIKYGKPDFVRESDIMEAIFADESFPQPQPRQSLQQSVNMPTVVQASRAPEEAEQAASSVQTSQQVQASGQIAAVDMDPNEIIGRVRCQICLDKPTEILFVPCTHTVCCSACGLTMKDCPMCRMPITGTVRVNI